MFLVFPQYLGKYQSAVEAELGYDPPLLCGQVPMPTNDVQPCCSRDCTGFLCVIVCFFGVIVCF